LRALHHFADAWAEKRWPKIGIDAPTLSRFVSVDWCRWLDSGCLFCHGRCASCENRRAVLRGGWMIAPGSDEGKQLLFPKDLNEFFGRQTRGKSRDTFY
jgi:hypothetical protein